ncbi:hypothetical protein NY2A_b563L [Paramecium bursaria Chlorella virus NY2A]|uniref:Uncharacterized protein b563L n=1 Tax=Paramecium bursaria Chlorella virus NY2A TaxID=46021 RepID=A7IX88_PBCVN|nr:hypothetical protein NY2A_b563L [Paramecium bursaria Chlorella virus NY2A]ABT14962.1 hypothetical protein NY2A_b563L [Paramecium bursaria Chlorella virus NY2A]
MNRVGWIQFHFQSEHARRMYGHLTIALWDLKLNLLIARIPVRVNGTLSTTTPRDGARRDITKIHTMVC